MTRLAICMCLFLCPGFLLAADNFPFRTVPQDVEGFNELPTRFIRQVNELVDGSLFVSTGAGIGKSFDNGKSYAQITMQSGLPSNNVRETAITDDGTIYVMAYAESLEMAMSSDGGKTFRNITPSLPNPNFSLGVNRQAFFTVGKRVILLMSDGQLFYNTDSVGGPFVKVNVITELGFTGSALSACATNNGDVIIGIKQSSGNAQGLKLGRMQLNGSHYSLAAVQPTDSQTSQYLQRSQNAMACSYRNGISQLALTRLDTMLAFLTLDDYKITYSHYIQIPTGSNPGDQPIYPSVLTRKNSLTGEESTFVVGYPVVMKLLYDANGKETGFTQLPLNPNDPNSPQNQINDIRPASNGDWLMATQWGWFRCNNAVTSCHEVIPTNHRFYDSGVLDQYSQGLIFPFSFFWTTATNVSSTHPLFWVVENQAWSLDRDFRKPQPFTYPNMDQYSVLNAKGHGDRMAVMTTTHVDNGIKGRVLYLNNGTMTSVDLPIVSRNMYPQIQSMDLKGERVYIDTEAGTYVADFGGNFTTFKGPSGYGASMFSNGETLLLTSDQAPGSLAVSSDHGKTFTIIPNEKFGMPGGSKVGLGAYRGIAIAAVANTLYQLSFSPVAGKLIFTDNSTQKLQLVGSSDAGLWLDEGPVDNTDSRPILIDSAGNCRRVSSANGFSGSDDYMGFIAGTVNSTLYFAGADGVMQQQFGANKAPDCGTAQMPQ